ncbi:MAG: cyclodeaminase/cyclohydrolase family protein [Planctomycetota bacterium]
MTDAAFDDFVARLAARTPAPGGGAASARTAAMGAALCAMVLRFSVDRPANAARSAAIAAAIGRLDETIARIRPLDERDMAAFEAVLAAYRLPKDDPARAVAIQTALIHAMDVPTEICAACAEALRLVEPLGDAVGRNIVVDLATGAELLLAAARSAHWMVAINATSSTDAAQAATALRNADGILHEVEERHARLIAHARKSIGQR